MNYLEINDLAEKNRSHSVDTYSKRKGMIRGKYIQRNCWLIFYFKDQSSKTSMQNKENSHLTAKTDIKKLIPKLRLDVLPNYHLKNTKALNPLNTQLNSQNSTNTLQNNTNSQIQPSIYNQPPNFANININKYIKK